MQLFGTTSAPSSPEITSISGASQNADVWGESHETPHVIQLQQAIKSISAASSSRLQLQSVQLQDILKQLQKLKPISSNDAPDDGQPTSSKEQELEWLLVSKTTAQVYGLVVNILLEQTIRLTRDIWYWDVILGSYSMTGLYSVQILPQRLWRWAREIYHDTRQRLQSVQNTTGPQSQRDTSIRDSWYRFYGLVKDSMRDHSITSMQSQLMSPLTLCRAGIRRKKSHLKRLREMSASSLGILMDEGLTFDMDDGTFTASEGHVSYDKEWRSVVSKSVTLMGTALQKVTILELGPSDFEESVFLCVDEDSETVQHRTGNEQLSAKSTWLANRLQQILSDYVPKHIATYEHLVAEHGKPSRIVRYWLPALMAILSSSTVLRICLNRKTEILEWIRDLGTTMRDFWYNWVVDPLKKVVGTIRHDEDSEVALMSKGSLEGDKASLERMVLDFVKDNSSSDTKFSDPEIASLRDKINEGDLTPVLKAYEKDLRRPIMGTIRGDLIRALLIQIQKTKVDIEVAVGGIDALLKSQELVFGQVA